MWKTWVALVVLAVLGYGTYRAGRHFWIASHHRAALGALEWRDLRQARRHLDQYLAGAPDDLDARLLAAQTTRRLGDFAAASAHLALLEAAGATGALQRERQLARVQQGDPAEADALFASCRANGDAAEAPLLLEAVVEGGLRSVAEATELGLSAEAQELAPELARTRQAVELWMQTRPAPVEQAQGLLWRGRLAALTSDHARAVAEMRQAVTLNPHQFEARLQLAVTVAYEAPQEALEHLQDLRRRYPDDRQVCFTLATVRRMLGQLPDAAALLDELLAADPSDVSALVERGYVAMNAKEAEEAERYLRRAFELAPQSPAVNLALSGCLTLAGRTREAQQYFERSEQFERERTAQKEAMLRQRKAAALAERSR
jgi:tetratricopeptide (TPR) repeat protein